MQTEVSRVHHNKHSADTNTLYMLGGVALMILGAGLVLSNRSVRRYISQIGIGDLVRNVLPDVEKYFQLRSM